MYRYEIVGRSVLESIANESLKIVANSRPLQFLLHEMVSPSALTRPQMNLNYCAIAHGHNQATSVKRTAKAQKRLFHFSVGMM